MTLKELEDKWHYRQLSPFGRELWDSFAEPDWCYPNGNNWGEDGVRTHIEHIKTKVRLALNYKHNLVTVYYEHGPGMGFVLNNKEQKLLLRRFKDCANRNLAFQFQIAPFKTESTF
jgi:hypothetical protein